jgi:integrase
MSKSALQTVRTGNAPPTVLDTERRQYVSEDEVERIIKYAKERDRLMILMAYRHGLRVSELINLT